MSEDVLFKVKGPVALITLNRPAQLNAINSGIRSGLTHAWKWSSKTRRPRWRSSPAAARR